MDAQITQVCRVGREEMTNSGTHRKISVSEWTQEEVLGKEMVKEVPEGMRKTKRVFAEQSKPDKVTLTTNVP